MTRAEQAVELIAPAIADREVLEVACGSAEFSLAAAEIAAQVTCIDLDDSRLSPEVGERENIRFRKMDAAAMRYGDGSFDTIVLYNAVFHLADALPAVLDECLRVLRPGGLLVVISSWSLDKPVLTDTLLPLIEARGLAYRLSMSGAFMWVRVRL